MKDNKHLDKLLTTYNFDKTRFGFFFKAYRGITAIQQNDLLNILVNKDSDSWDIFFAALALGVIALDVAEPWIEDLAEDKEVNPNLQLGARIILQANNIFSIASIPFTFYSDISKFPGWMVQILVSYLGDHLLIKSRSYLISWLEERNESLGLKKLQGILNIEPTHEILAMLDIIKLYLAEQANEQTTKLVKGWFSQPKLTNKVEEKPSEKEKKTSIDESQTKEAKEKLESAEKAFKEAEKSLKNKEEKLNDAKANADAKHALEDVAHAKIGPADKKWETARGKCGAAQNDYNNWAQSVAEYVKNEGFVSNHSGNHPYDHVKVQYKKDGEYGPTEYLKFPDDLKDALKDPDITKVKFFRHGRHLSMPVQDQNSVRKNLQQAKKEKDTALDESIAVGSAWSKLWKEYQAAKEEASKVENDYNAELAIYKKALEVYQAALTAYRMASAAVSAAAIQSAEVASQKISAVYKMASKEASTVVSEVVGNNFLKYIASLSQLIMNILFSPWKQNSPGINPILENQNSNQEQPRIQELPDENILPESMQNQAQPVNEIPVEISEERRELLKKFYSQKLSLKTPKSSGKIKTLFKNKSDSHSKNSMSVNEIKKLFKQEDGVKDHSASTREVSIEKENNSQSPEEFFIFLFQKLDMAIQNYSSADAVGNSHIDHLEELKRQLQKIKIGESSIKESLGEIVNASKKLPEGNAENNQIFKVANYCLDYFHSNQQQISSNCLIQIERPVMEHLNYPSSKMEQSVPKHETTELNNSQFHNDKFSGQEQAVSNPVSLTPMTKEKNQKVKTKTVLFSHGLFFSHKRNEKPLDTKEQFLEHFAALEEVVKKIASNLITESFLKFDLTEGNLNIGLDAIKKEIEKIKDDECTIKEGLENIIRILKNGKLLNHPLLKATRDCHNFFDCNQESIGDYFKDVAKSIENTFT